LIDHLRQNRKNNFPIFVLLTAIFFGLGAYISVWLALMPGPLKENKIVVINKGSLFKVACQLEGQGVIKNKHSFFFLAKFANLFADLKAGEYELQGGSSIWNVINSMQSGNFLKRSLTVPEGSSTNQVLEIVEQNSHLSGAINEEKYLEGELLPETYFFIRGEKRENILDRMSKSMSKAVDKAWAGRDKDVPLKSKEDLVILASIVEKEAKLEEERPIIASVFVNRIKKKMKLESDPTTIYAITGGKRSLERLLTRADLQIQSPFNTYFAHGLPPTPIANPGLSAITAAASPATTKYIFFVVKDCQGRHNFAITHREHLSYVKKYKKLKCY